MKAAWRKDLVDLAAWNSNQVEEVEDLDMKMYEELLHEDALIRSWAEEEGSFFDLNASAFT